MCIRDSGTPILGVPGGVLFSKPTAFDEIVPRLIADDEITKEDCIALGHGGFLGSVSYTHLIYIHLE